MNYSTEKEIPRIRELLEVAVAIAHWDELADPEVSTTSATLIGVFALFVNGLC